MQTKQPLISISLEFEPEAAFVRDVSTQGIEGGSSMVLNKFFDAKTQESWLGKCDAVGSEAASQVSACREKLANDLYGYYGVTVPRLRISRQTISQTTQETYGFAMAYAYHVMSRWLDRFQVYGYPPEFKSGQAHHLLQVTVENQTQSLREEGLGHILAVAHWLNDIDVMSPSGKNVGYQLKLDGDGKLYAKSCKIDPGYAFANFKETGSLTKTIQLSTQNHHVLFEDLPLSTQREYLLTVKKIVATSDQQMAAFFADKQAQRVLESAAAKAMDNFIPIEGFIQRLIARRDELKRLHHAAFEKGEATVVPRIPAMPDILQRLYCQAKLEYDLVVKDKAAFYVPLDVTASADSEERLPMDMLWGNFLKGFSPHALSPLTVTTKKTTAAIAPTQTLLLLGASGSGKSLATQLLVNQLWEAFLRSPKKSPIPLRIELKQFSERTVGQCVINTLLDEYRYSPVELCELQQYPFVFIFDGYDELAGQAKMNLMEKHQATEQQYGHWSAQFVITCRDSYFQGIADKSLFYSPQTGNKELTIRYVSSLTPAHQIDYLMRYKKQQEQHYKKILPDYQALLTEHPHLHSLLGNPFLLRIFRDALPRWQADHPHTSLKDLTRYDLYTAFMDQWFASEALRYSMIQAKCLSEDLPAQFLDFSLRLAFQMHVHQLDEVNVEQADQTVWERFFSDQNEAIQAARAGCPLRRLGLSRYSFVHKSFLEYFVARRLWEALIQGDHTLWNQRLLPETREILQFLVEHWTLHKAELCQARLWDWVQQSKRNPTVSIAAANAITVLHQGGLGLIGEYGDLAEVNMAGADLSGAHLDHACLRGANLQGVNLSQAWLRGSAPQARISSRSA